MQKYVDFSKLINLIFFCIRHLLNEFTTKNLIKLKCEALKIKLTFVNKMDRRIPE
jgi:hypothetical protein